MPASPDFCKTFRKALVDSYSRDEMKFLLQEFGVSLAHIDTSGPLENTFDEVIDWFNRRERLPELILASSSERPCVEALRSLASVVEKVSVHSKAVDQTQGMSAEEVAASLRNLTPFSITGQQACVLAASISEQTISLAEATKKQDEARQRICVIEVHGQSIGTGFLIGPQQILTNRHVLDRALELKGEKSQVQAVFDHRGDRNYEDLPRKVILLNASSPKGEAIGIDYAVLQLEPKDAEPNRGFFSACPDRLKDKSPVAILGHPANGTTALSLQYTWGMIRDINDNKRTIGYTAWTSPGYSGSPVFNANFDLVGLHYHGQESVNNHGIPIWAIAEDLKHKGFEWPLAASESTCPVKLVGASGPIRMQNQPAGQESAVQHQKENTPVPPSEPIDQTIEKATEWIENNPKMDLIHRGRFIYLSITLLLLVGVSVGLYLTSPKAGDIKEVSLPGGVAMKLVWCPPGTFEMGSPLTEIGRRDDEDDTADQGGKPVQVALTNGFWLGQTEVTQEQWNSVMGMNSKPWSGKDFAQNGPDYPASYISHGAKEDGTSEANSATAFCERLTEIEQKSGRLSAGWRYALPTEAQWEYACRAGSTTYEKYYFGDDESKLGNYAWWGGNDGNNGNTKAEKWPHVAKDKLPNEWGLYDMHGNLYEWSRDWYDGKLLGGTNPSGPPTGSERVIRGGGWSGKASFCRTAYRSHILPNRQFDYTGFRICLCFDEHEAWYPQARANDHRRAPDSK